jgi:hypothetical protein
MTITQQFKDAKDFWEGMVIPDCADFRSDTSNLRFAMHSAVSLFHMSDWAFHSHESIIRAKFSFTEKGVQKNIADEKEFANSLQQSNSNFGLIRGIAHASKHNKLTKLQNIPNFPSHSANTRIQEILYVAAGYAEYGYFESPQGVVLEGADGINLDFIFILNDVYGMWEKLIRKYNLFQI